MRTRFLLPMVLAAAGCAPQPPTTEAPILVTLGTFEGEIDADAGTVVVRSMRLTRIGGAPGTAVAIPEGADGVTIANNGAASVVDGPGPGCRTVLAAPVRITLGASSPGLAGGLYAEIQSLSGTGGEGCNSATAPTGLDATKGLWSYGTVRPGATTADVTWQLRWVSGQRTTFTGRIVGVLGVTFGYTVNMPAALGDQYYRDPIIAYTRNKMAYASASGKIVYVNLDGTYSSSVTLPSAPGTATAEAANSLAFHAGASAASDVLWFTTNNHVGVVHGGSVYSSQIDPEGTYAGHAGGASIAVDPTTENRAFFVSRGESGFRSATFDPAATPTPTVTPGTPVSTGNPPWGLAIAAATAPETGTWIYVSTNIIFPGNVDWMKAYTLGGALASTIYDRTGLAFATCSDAFSMNVSPVDGKLWYASCTPVCGFCSYDPSVSGGSYERFSQVSSASSVSFAKAVMGADTVPWGSDIGGNPNYAWQIASGSTFRVTYPDTGWPTSVPSSAGSPAVSVEGTDYPAYLWVTTGNGLLRLQP
ncbi:MAG: hypothetical protein WB493_01480 [Anaeromyxobacteraceae bacterium]